MPGQDTEMLPMFGDVGAERYGAGLTETRITKAIEAVNETNPLNATRLAIAEVARALAQNIDRGNVKGRSIGNEAAQLIQCLAIIEGVEEAGAASDMPATVQEVMNALGSVPRPQ